MPLDAARDGLITLQAQLIVVLAERNSALEARVDDHGQVVVRGIAKLGELLDAAVGR